MSLFAFGRRIIVIALLVLWALPAQAIPQLLVDMHTNEVLFEEDAGQPWHPASLTKLMTAFLAFEAIANGEVALDTPVIVSAHALKAPPSKIGAPVGTAYTMEDALYLLIVKSANDIAIAIAETIGGSELQFVAQMNAMAARLGMSATRYVNPNGLHDPQQVTTARDLAVLALTIRHRHPQYAPMFATESVRLGKARLRSHNNLLTHFEGTTGMKTGYVCASGLNIVATVERQGRSLMAVVLGGTSGRERGELAAQMMQEALLGRLAGQGKNVTMIANRSSAPVNMRPYICGKQAKTYVAERVAAFPMGLEGEPSFLTDSVQPAVHRARSLGRLRDVPLPRPRPSWAPIARAAVKEPPKSSAPELIPLPRPRPLVRASLRAGL